MSTRPAIVASVFYRDPIAAMQWLERAFGFETTTLLTDAEGKVGFAEMEFRGSPVGIAQEWTGAQLGGANMTCPANLGGSGAQFPRVALESRLDDHCTQARAAGARITAEPEDQFYGARTYRAMDPEGHVWNFSQEVSAPSVAEMERASGLRFHSSLEEVGHG